MKGNNMAGFMRIGNCKGGHTVTTKLVKNRKKQIKSTTHDIFWEEVLERRKQTR